MPNQVTSFPHGTCRKKIGRFADSAEGGVSSKKKRQNDHWIKPYASHSSFVKFGHLHACPATEPAVSIIHHSYKDEKCMRKLKRKAPFNSTHSAVTSVYAKRAAPLPDARTGFPPSPPGPQSCVLVSGCDGRHALTG